MRPSLRGELPQIARFLLLGALNSLFSLVLYVLLQRAMPIPPAYTLAYVGGITLNTLLSGRVVFGVVSTRAQRVLAFLGYLAVFLTGLATVQGLQSGLGASPLAAGMSSILLTAPLNYLVGRAAFPSNEDPALLP